MADITIADEQIPHLMRLSREYNVELTRLVNLIIAIGIETLEAVDFEIDESIPYTLEPNEQRVKELMQSFQQEGG